MVCGMLGSAGLARLADALGYLLAMPRQEALVTPGLLKWARTTAGLTVETVGAKLRVAGGGEVVAAWESGEVKPSMAQARKLAQLYRRPLEVFYLASPPEERGAVPDFRSKAGAPVSSPDLLWAVRRLRGLRESALELASDRGPSRPSR